MTRGPTFFFQKISLIKVTLYEDFARFANQDVTT